MGKHALPRFRIAVVGAGAVGSYYGAKLAGFGRDVHFLLRGDLAEVQRSGLRIRSRSGDLHVAKVNGYTSTAEIGPSDLVIIAVKTTANPDLLHLLPPLLHGKSMLLTLQNGLGNEEFLARHFGAERVLGGLCFVGLNRVASGVIEHYDGGRMMLAEFGGYPQPRTHDIGWEFKRCGVVCTVAENLGFERWRKLVWNIPFNGLAVVAGGLDTAEILRDDTLRARALALMDEVIAGANACGYTLPTAVALKQIKTTETMRPYKPSTLVDFEAGKPLELEAIWGEPLRRATARGVHLPELERLYAELCTLDTERQGNAASASKARA